MHARASSTCTAATAGKRALERGVQQQRLRTRGCMRTQSAHGARPNAARFDIGGEERIVLGRRKPQQQQFRQQKRAPHARRQRYIHLTAAAIRGGGNSVHLDRASALGAGRPQRHCAAKRGRSAQHVWRNENAAEG